MSHSTRASRPAACLLALSLLWLPGAGLAQAPVQAPSAQTPSAAPVAGPQSTVPAAPATAPDTTAEPAVVPAAELKLPRDLSPWGMFMAADIVVKRS